MATAPPHPTTGRADAALAASFEPQRLSAEEALRLLDLELEPLLAAAEALTLAGHGSTVTYSRKVFIPLTQLCRDVCHYCTFAKAPRAVAAPYLSLEESIEIARRGAAAGCKEALFTLGDKPELRYSSARAALAAFGYSSTLEYLGVAARAVYRETGLLPHLNAGVMTRDELARLRPVAASMGIMLESSSERLCRRGGPHWGSPDKLPATRLATIAAAGELAIPFTTGLLIGIGETRRERIEALLALRALHERHGHLQELILQNFRAKPGTRMAGAPEPSLAEQQWTIAVARLIFGPQMSLQAPPNLRPGALGALLRAGVNDWGGVSPITPDHVNPEAPWPHLEVLARESARAGRVLIERLAVTPHFALEPAKWLDSGLQSAIRVRADSSGRARSDDWHAGSADPLPAWAENWLADETRAPCSRASRPIERILERALKGAELEPRELVALFSAHGPDLERILAAADTLREQTVGPRVTYVVTRNINYTNICLYHCGFCAFSKSGSKRLRGPGYRLDLEEIARRTSEAAARGATEVCLQGGIHPEFTGRTYLDIVAAVKEAVPRMHVHAFSPLEVTHGARTLGLPLETYLARLRAAGLSTLPGTAAEILDDDIRAVICPDKVTTEEWLSVMRAAHAVGLKSTATIMFGHVDQPLNWARHLLRLRALQVETGGFTELVPLPFVHMEAPLWRRGLARPGPTFREALLMHAVGRLALHPHVRHIQTSWVKMSPRGAAACLRAGADDLGGTLMNESITRAAGGVHGQEMTAEALAAIAAAAGARPLIERTTLYAQPNWRETSLKMATPSSSTRSAMPIC
ncbi:MAG TPA: 5-amino-6-(D-ribitylamino)uracil--L-tyrosine 4-hydroxyphenyl transferase CofH [Steroidobacteraceae bacterium]|nr:5-amino-6-(D-ribitylamino)uracil--L-tyrosine 4-hydroxyphenyl transferase CofH [Steroidobacteraceae bacterium]